MRYFHACVVIRRRRNKIEGLQSEGGEWIWEPKELKKMVFDNFAKLYSEEDSRLGLFDVPRGRFPVISVADYDELYRPFTEENVKEALFSTNPLKASGPDGYHAIFYQSNWDIVCNEVNKEALRILHGGEIVPELNKTLLVLISKLESPQNVNQLRPISLCNVGFKVITKEIVAKLKGIMRKIVAPTQSSFVPRRQIYDNIVTAQEVMHSMKQRAVTRFMALKIDLEKAYDKIQWAFIEDTLR